MLGYVIRNFILVTKTDIKKLRRTPNVTYRRYLSFMQEMQRFTYSTPGFQTHLRDIAWYSKGHQKLANNPHQVVIEHSKLFREIHTSGGGV